MNRNAGVASLLLAAFFLAGVERANAGFIPAVGVEGGVEGVDGLKVYGYSITIGSAPLTIDALGALALGIFVDQGSTHDTDYIRIVQGPGHESTLIAIAAIPIGSPISNGYYYSAISPVTMLPGQTYGVYEDLAADGTGILSLASYVTGGSGFTINGSYSGGVFGSPDIDYFGAGGYGGPSFETAAVPEPASLVLCAGALGGGLLCCLCMRLRSR
jgi:hypothetical protein